MNLPPRSFDPFRVKTVEPIALTTAAQRRVALEHAQFNLFRIPADQVMIDLITDSGTGAMSSRQWAGMMRGDESYAGSASFHRLTETITQITGLKHVLPTHQGRVSERLLVEAIIGTPHAGNGKIVPNNAHFDTTRFMIEASGAEAFNFLGEGGDDPESDSPFKGDMHIADLEDLLQRRGKDVPFVMLTITCNSNGGQPVSLKNIKHVRALCDKYKKKLFLDACRFAENAWFIKRREPGQSNRSIAEIVRDMFDLCDGAVMSARKDALANCGGMLIVRDETLFKKACSLCVLTQGFQMTYGSLAARDLEAIAVGMTEALDENYLAARRDSIDRLAKALTAGGVKLVQPIGGHAVWIDARAFAPHLPDDVCACHAVACALYEHGGIRGTCIGSVLKDPRNGDSLDLLRLAVPRRTYTPSHLDYVAAVVCDLKQHASMIKPPKVTVPRTRLTAEPDLQPAM